MIWVIVLEPLHTKYPFRSYKCAKRFYDDCVYRYGYNEVIWED